MGFSIKSSTTEENTMDSIELISYTYDDYTKLVNPINGSEDIYFKSTLIYSSEHIEDSIIKTYYSSKGEYSDTMDTVSKVRQVAFTDIQDVDKENARLLEFYHYSKLYNNNPNTINFLKFAKAQRKYKNSTRTVLIMENDKLMLDSEDDKVKEFYKLERISQTLSTALPYFIAADKINDAIAEINSYIASGTMNMDTIISSLETLKDCDFCESSYKVIKQVVDNENVDYRDVLEKLNSYYHNIDTIIKLYTNGCELTYE